MNDLPIRDDLRGEQPYGAPQIAVPVVLNVNENPYPPSEALVANAAAAVAEVVRGLNRYPDREATQLRADLARYLEKESGVTVETRQVWAANGSNEIMQQILQAFGGPGRIAMSFEPTYSMYPEYVRNTNTGYVAIPRAEDFSIDRSAALDAIASHRPSIILLASPNNPTGTAMELDLISEIHQASDAVVVVDEAYAEFRRAGTNSAATLIKTHPRLVVVRTMSKAFAFAGARVGYAIAAIPVIDALRIVRLPYHLSAVTQVVARVALAHVDELQANVARLRTDRDALAEWLLWNGFEAPPSDANFIFFGRFADRHAVWQGLVDRGILIREVGPDGWLRVSIGRPDEITAFKSALLEVVDVLGGSVEQADAPLAQRAVPADSDDVQPAPVEPTPVGPAAAGVAAPPAQEWDEIPVHGDDPEPAAPVSHVDDDASVVGSLPIADAGAGSTVEAVGSKLQALRGDGVGASVLDGMDVEVELPVLDPIRDVDADDDQLRDDNGVEPDLPTGDTGGHDEDADDVSSDVVIAVAAEDEIADEIDDELNERAAARDEEIALAVLRDRAEASADQLTEQIVDGERQP